MIPPLPTEYWDSPSQAYGVIDWATYPKTGRHIGTDFGTPLNTPHNAPIQCTITRVGYYPASLGYWCEIDMGGWYIIDAHLRERPKVGVYEAGQTYGYTGASGKIRGIHSHIEGWYAPMNRNILTKDNWNLLTFDVREKF